MYACVFRRDMTVVSRHAVTLMNGGGLRQAKKDDCRCRCGSGVVDNFISCGIYAIRSLILRRFRCTGWRGRVVLLMAYAK